MVTGAVIVALPTLSAVRVAPFFERVLSRDRIDALPQFVNPRLEILHGLHRLAEPVPFGGRYGNLPPASDGTNHIEAENAYRHGQNGYGHGESPHRVG
jgi:hypothetical protein